VWWIGLFHDCHEWRWDGGTLPARRNKRQVIRSGYYSRLEWPEPGGVMRQANLTVEAFGVIKDEEARMLAEQAR
jgi:hypothetical protein